MDRMTHEQAAKALDDLEDRLPRMIQEHDGSHLMDPVAGEAEVIEFQFNYDERIFFRNRLQCMLRDAGLIPGDDEPCAADAADARGRVPSA